MTEQDTLKQILKALEDIDRRLIAIEARPIVQPVVVPSIWPTDIGPYPNIPNPTITWPDTGAPIRKDFWTSITLGHKGITTN